MTFSSDRNSAQNFEELCSHLFSYDKIDWRILLISDMLINFCYPKKLMTAEFSNNFNRCKTVLKPSNTKILFLDTRIPLDILNNYVVICFFITRFALAKSLRLQNSPRIPKGRPEMQSNLLQIIIMYHYYLQNRSKAFKQRKTFSSDGLPCRNCKIAIVNSVYTSSKTCNGNKTWAAFHTL